MASTSEPLNNSMMQMRLGQPMRSTSSCPDQRHHRPKRKCPRVSRLGRTYLLLSSLHLPFFACNHQSSRSAYSFSLSPASEVGRRRRSSSSWSILKSGQRNPFASSERDIFFLSSCLQRRTQQSRCCSTTLALHLFFPRSQTSSQETAATTKPNSIPPYALEELQSPTLTFPFRIRLSHENDDEEVHDPLTNDEEELVVRFMTPEDIPELVPLCVNEFGEGSPAMAVAQSTLSNLPWREPGKMRTWWDQLFFEKTVAWTLQLKLRANLPLPHSPSPSASPRNFADPAMLVLTRRSILGDDEDSDNDESIVGMVELSLQPPIFDRNPPALPLPRWVKESLASKTELGTVQGWVTNLLIDPSYRGRGYSKVLMAATEGVAKSWKCRYIFLHADADIRSGRIPQRLYEGLGYTIVTGQGKEEYSWAGTASGLDQFSSIRMVDGVALLCFSKKLV